MVSLPVKSVNKSEERITHWILKSSLNAKRDSLKPAVLRTLIAVGFVCQT